MCGIVGIVGNQPVSERLVEALKRLEYRGYDSAGVATIDAGTLKRRRAEGKLVNLESRLREEPLAGTIGIAHTRWATHGAPTERNAHPHFTEGVAVVHNGIIENFAELKDELAAGGAEFQTETDTEVVAHLLAKYRRDGLGRREAMHAMLKRVKGAYALAVLFEDDPSTIMAARNGPPLAIGHGNGEMFLGSDAIALAPFTNEITYLIDGDWAVIGKTGVHIFDFDGNVVERPRQISTAAAFLVDKGNHRHFMEKEIYEQPEVIAHALGHYVNFIENRVVPISDAIDFGKVPSLAISACGTAYLAGLIGKYWFERYARLPVEIDVASEFRYREIPLSPQSAALFISQSGETADTLASLRYCKEHGLKIGAVVNARESTIARESDAVFPILAGPEIGVASTKAFTCQLAVLAALAVGAGKARGTISGEEEQALVKSLAEMPRIMGQVLNSIQPKIESLSRELSKCHDVLYLGRGTSFPLAMEGALKLKEISYIHAEGYAAGELKHGPIALIDENMPVIVIAPHDRFFDKTVSNMQEVAARGGRIILITDEKGAAASKLDTMHTIVLPEVDEIIAPMIFSLPVQLLAYHTAVFMGTDVDQPRNLAKSVTVE
ncbi:glutamine--fructose-6-phosphate transaminase (isomerizing) [Sinorhizobium meliloti]|jgi:glucosamine--fructose-6-phosphate aminotransferase (isomerizing)|uniref:glutamine--fructose-6-phosphate transaminase (isomerizing) n=3 Tax=Rhizobium meliloti TaxID=382 RepID=UPI00028615B9|nr:glutamine--fructose-6-phosphate transaminase (isomerizing) [Sinorhizobium meliloti]ASP77055.1 glutamine--fructose-6-phosphate transaminase (isomerizing) [Sinorhizobium meliloti]MDW9356189.1 glutamine--fructose-6-phosphate transaminase (isomerizing) [Sinorhizobium meliloti]MDW9463076.1 glutamine--fructose-6-phosphate transaminase (isomerizing) [Sinorhizobium meliloti]MDW9656570.1 glutamine--fructose-6-phosphate transaminase (isomerizing) [Sinorhizobium meliloti]MDW9916380.1 glutamine--fructo